MNIDVAKRIVEENILVRHKFLYKGCRNQNEEFSGMISKMFPAVFLIKLDNSMVKAFSYSDLIIGNLKILTEK